MSGVSDLNLLYPTPANDYVSSVQVPFSLFVLGVPLLLFGLILLLGLLRTHG